MNQQHIPILVQQAMELAASKQFGNSCTPEIGRLLHVLAAQHHKGCIGEIGTGCGVGAAWIISALAPQATFVTVELDADRAGATTALFAAYPQVRVLHGDWLKLLPYAPFVLLFVDARSAKEYDPEPLIHALEPGGMLVLDDLTPESAWTPEQRALWSNDPLRRFWLNDPRMAASEILVTPQSAAILATRRPF